MKSKFRLLGLVGMIMLFVLSSQTYAKNADLSQWLKNLSESAMETAPGDPDWAPQVVVSGDTVHVLWMTRTADWSLGRVYYRRSLDKGKTWQPKVLISEQPYDDIGLNSDYRRMAVDGKNVHIFINGTRHHEDSGGWYMILSYFRSTDNGATFDTEKRIVTAADDHLIDGIYAHAANGKVKVGYTYIRNWEVKDSVNVLTSDDNGDTFTNYQVAFFDYENGDHGPTLYDMQVDGEKVYLVYGDSYYNYGLRLARLYFARSLDGGVTFKSQEIDIPSNEDNKPKSMADQDYHYVPKIAFAGSNVYTVFNGYGSDGNFSVYLRRSEDNGTTFAPAVNLSHDELPDKDILSGQVTLAAQGTNLYVIFQLYQGINDYNTPLYLKRSTDAGRSFKPIQELTAPHYYSAWAPETRWPVIKLDPSDRTGSHVYVAANALFFVSSNDAGAHFTREARLDPYANSRLGRTQIAVGDHGEVHLVADGDITHYDTGVNGDSDIFYRVFNPTVPVHKATGNKSLFLTHKENEGDGTGVERWDTMEIASSPALEFKKALTVEAWVKVNRVEGKDGSLIVKTDEWVGDICYPYYVGQGRDGKIDVRIATTDGGYKIIAGDPIPNGKWTHVAMSYNADGGENNFKVYVNGKLVGQETATGTLLTGRHPLLITWDGYYVTYNNLSIDELRFWNRALSQREIQNTINRSLSGTESGLVAYYTFNEPFNRYGTVRDITGGGNKGILLYKEQLSKGKDLNFVPLAPIYYLLQ